MITLLKKELNSFLASLTGYLVIVIFLLATGLFLWIIPGDSNLIDGQRSSLKTFFEIAPWLYLFLIPAITMRMFAEEKKTGTIEILFTRPVSLNGIIMAKYLASFILVIISLLPTLIYFFSIYKLGNPQGNIDTGATWGSYIGLLFLASAYIAIGLFSSAMTSNQVVSFLTAVVLSYLCYLGFEYAAELSLPSGIKNILISIGINDHYISLSRGVIDSRDIFYFILLSVIFLFLSHVILSRQRIKKHILYKPLAIIITATIISSLLISYRIFRIDLTSEKRYSLSEISKKTIKDFKQPINIEIYLTGNLPAGMNDFRKSIIEKIEDFNSYSPSRIFYHEFDIYETGNEKERDEIINNLIESGIQPINLEHKTTEGLSTKQIFPGAIIQSGNKAITLNLLRNNPNLSGEENLGQSTELLEFEFLRALKYLKQKDKKKIAFLKGHGEADENETGDIRYYLKSNYEVEEIFSDDLFSKEDIDVLVIADPQEKFSESDKLAIDQYIMSGGKTLWCIDPVFASIDSLSKGYSTIAFERDLNLRDQLFRYGVRLNADLVQDAFCMQYPVNTAPPGQPTKFMPAPFYFSPVAVPDQGNPVSRNINNISLEFPGSLDIVGEDGDRKSKVILSTSPYGRSVTTPVEVSLQSATTPPDKRYFNKPNIPIGVIIEGRLESVFQNRMTKQLGFDESDLIKTCENSKMIVISDGGIIKNKVRIRNGRNQILPLGYDQFSGQTFGNRDFIINCIDYLADDFGIMELRSRTLKLRILDKVKIREEKIKWQILNVLIPIIIIILSGIVYNILRKRKYSTKR
ncbi:MAG: gliding motility-associated ABC transporter substrate-binding protein GldG [Prolixibacteraceae bacterium]|nr:gliding motility-associated ABC transporter substrate-binding protein GldG [Prolixibacteraceae bacterium]